MSSTPAETIFAEQAVSKDEDNETEISQYLTLTQLGNILRELSVLGKTLACIHGKQPKTAAEVYEKSTAAISKLFPFVEPWT